ncbi:alkaline shock response membrane anchor protein AmaP [Lactobacillus sp. ESL0701]|uniref:alkaline shock response membrane anchor protein AmaP n=1 Tax=Lactobacillus sp. ESL0701 TaxID=2983217 RepID=UPI0023F785BD|nr:alkaline shock response membrane anchor protein AmaP [Lactobacillus sp. ESL0701]MDF7671722.1 alkaline shock response membrane anchor protein AmaP [Lactobacillus sp. ESL0701]
MKRSKKWLLILCLIIVLPLPTYLLWQTSGFWQKYLQLKLPSISAVSPIFTWYLIAVSAVMVVSLIISLLILLFWPTQRSFNLIPKQSGQVKITSKAVNGFILSSLNDLPYLNNAKVDSKLTKRRIKINVRGDLGAGEDVANLLEDYLQKVKVDLKQLLGIEQKPKIIIKFTNYHNGEVPDKRVQ